MYPKFCNKCGNPLIEGDKFCRSCGEPVVVRNAAPVPPAPEQNRYSMPAAPAAPAQMGTPNIPSYEEVAARFNAPDMARYDQPQQYAPPENPEGTVSMVNMMPQQGGLNSVIKAEIKLPLSDVLRGCTKVLDFGTGEKFEVAIPAGLSPGDVVLVTDTGIKNPETGETCDFELRITMG